MFLLHRIKIGFFQSFFCVVVFDCECFPIRRWSLIHCINHYSFHHRAQAACSELIFNCLVDNQVEHAFAEHQLNTIHQKQFFILLYDGIFRFCQDSLEGFSIQRLEICQNRESTDNLRDKPERKSCGVTYDIRLSRWNLRFVMSEP